MHGLLPHTSTPTVLAGPSPKTLQPSSLRICLFSLPFTACIKNPPGPDRSRFGAAMPRMARSDRRSTRMVATLAAAAAGGLLALVPAAGGACIARSQRCHTENDICDEGTTCFAWWGTRGSCVAIRDSAGFNCVRASCPAGYYLDLGFDFDPFIPRPENRGALSPAHSSPRTGSPGVHGRALPSTNGLPAPPWAAKGGRPRR